MFGMVNATEQSYVPAHLAIEAMRDNGYKNTAYAVAELLDNSIQAEASLVQLLCAERDIQIGARKIRKIEEIAVLDNGIGMNEDVLQMALQFGNGTRLGKNQRTGMGRFGMGLPASSISQCKRVDVWSWQNGLENAMHVYLDIDEIKDKKTTIIPAPTRKNIPSVWLNVGKFSNSGTLVIWSKLDRMMWSRGQTLIKHSELIIGRMYRKFLHDSSLSIQLNVFDLNDLNLEINKPALPNDPCYLMDQTSCPEPFNNDSMFNSFCDDETYIIDLNGEKHELIVRYSIAKEEARVGDNSGSKPHGRHAKENIGISIVRAGRELDLDQSLVLQEATERWWGIEVEFPPSLDELMGVSNNKQSARNFTDVLKLIDDIEKMQKEGKLIPDIKEEYYQDGDPRGPLIDVCLGIKRTLINIRRVMKNQNTGLRAKRYEPTNVEIKATEKTQERINSGHIGESDSYKVENPEKQKEEMKESLINKGLEAEDAVKIAEKTVISKLKYSFNDRPFEGEAFFTVQTSGGAIHVLLNTRHPAYEHLVEVLDVTSDDQTAKQLKERLDKASEGLRLLLAAWARYEDETPDGGRRDMIQDVRTAWGRYARDFLRKNY
jgi:hypothetical protein